MCKEKTTKMPARMCRKVKVYRCLLGWLFPEQHLAFDASFDTKSHIVLDTSPHQLSFL